MYRQRVLVAALPLLCAVSAASGCSPDTSTAPAPGSSPAAAPTSAEASAGSQTATSTAPAAGSSPASVPTTGIAPAGSPTATSTGAAEGKGDWTYGSNTHGPKASVTAASPAGARLTFETGGVGSRARITLPPGAALCDSTRTLTVTTGGRAPASTRGGDIEIAGVVEVVVSPVAGVWAAAATGAQLTIESDCAGRRESFVFPVAGLDTARMPGFPSA